jgi:hypothetical protein
MWLNIRDYTTLHSDTDWSKATACNKKDTDVTEHERLCNITLRNRLK